MVSSKLVATIFIIVLVVCSAVAASAAHAPRLAHLTGSGEIVLRVRDNLSGVDPSSIRVIVDGQEVRPSLTKIPLGYRVSYTPTASSSGEHSVVLFASDMAKNAMRRAYRFVSTCRVAADNGPQPLREAALARRPLLDRVADSGIDPMRCLDTSQTRLRLTPEHGGTCGLRHVSARATILAALKPAPLFDVKISKQLRESAAVQVYDVTFTVSGTGALTEGYELFVGLIDPSGEVVFYEPRPGCRGTPLEQLKKTGESGLKMRLSFERGEFAGSGYTWCAAVAKAQSPDHLASNVATSPFDVIPGDCDVRASSGDPVSLP